ncbi:MAG TPA: HIT domain-containing protein [Dehalococcoidia bacterium]|nr:HIT domain-containing protein [Dehalococcoidia bacterium]
MAECLFCAMAAGTIAVDKLHDDELVFAIRDINPRAPVHLLIIPKEHIPDGRHVGDEHGAALARMFAVAQELGRAENLERRGYRLAFNVGEDAGMTIPHLHMHLVGGRRLGAEG